MPYRDLEALRARHSTLLNRLGEIQAQARDLDALRREEADVRRALAETDALLRRVEARRPLPLLASVKVASPCSAKWEDMTGDDTKRFCGACAKNVYNLSAMGAEEAEALLRKEEGELCVRLYRRADGTVMTADCPVGARRKRVRRIAAVAVGAGAALTAAAASVSTATMGARARPIEVQQGQWTTTQAAEMGAPVEIMGRRHR